MPKQYCRRSCGQFHLPFQDDLYSIECIMCRHIAEYTLDHDETYRPTRDNLKKLIRRSLLLPSVDIITVRSV